MKRLVCILGLACVLVLPTGASADPVLNGHSGWYWGSPRPQGQDLRALECSGLRCYAVGDLGTVVKSDDGGATWSGASTGTLENLEALRIIPGDPNSLFAAGACSALGSSDGGSKISHLPSLVGCTTTNPLRSLSFPQGANGIFLLGDGSVFSTANQGTSFSRKQSIPGSLSAGGVSTANSIFFLDLNSGFAVADNKTSGSIYRTANGGGSWTLAAAAPGGLRDIYFVTPLVGYAVGASNIVLKTVDGGGTWAIKPITVGAAKTLTSIRCASETLCLIANSTGRGLLRTADGGDTFTEITPSDRKIVAVSFASPLRVLGVGERGTMVVSGDAGLTFAPVGSEAITRPVVERLTTLSSSTAFAYGTGGYLTTTKDAGKTWTPINGPTSETIKTASFTSSSVGVVLSGSGALYRTEDAGVSWSVLNPGTSQIDTVLLAGPSSILLTGRSGLLRSTDGGQSFARVKSKVIGKSRITRFKKVGKAIFGFARGRIFHSVNGGTTWKSIALPAKAELLIDGLDPTADCTTLKRCWMISTARNLYSTTNGGKSWTENLGVGDDLGMVEFSSPRSGWAVRKDLFRMHHTSDGGRTWRPQILAEKQIASFASKDATVFALSYVLSPLGTEQGTATSPTQTGKSSALFATQTGGDLGKTSSLRLKASKTLLARAGAVRITGKLSPAVGGESVEISYRAGSRAGWVKKSFTVASNGTFTHNMKVKKTTAFVAQFAGASNQNGAGSKVITVRVGR